VGRDLASGHVQMASQAVWSGDFLKIHQISSVAAGIVLMALLASSHGPTHHLFWPVFSFGLGVYIAALVTGYVLTKIKASWIIGSKPKRLVASAVVAALIASVGGIGFSWAQIPHKLDLKEYNALMAEHFNGSLKPEEMRSDDLDFIKFMVLTYEPLGVDVSDAKKALDDAAKIT